MASGSPPRTECPESTFVAAFGVPSVFFGSSRHRSARGNPRAAEDSDAGIPGTSLRQTQQLEEWRRSTQRVTRAWNAWLAAERRDRATRYRIFVAALADEERAAGEVERMVDLADAGACVATTDPRNGRLGAR
jgi:hypothetical protein